MSHTITKKDEELEYHKIVTSYTVEINGKTVRGTCYSLEDNVADNYDGGTELNEDDMAKLTDDERQAIEDNFDDARLMEDGQSFTYED